MPPCAEPTQETEKLQRKQKIGSPWSREGQYLCGNRTIIKDLTQETKAQNIYISDDSCMRSQVAGKREEGLEVTGKACGSKGN